MKEVLLMLVLLDANGEAIQTGFSELKFKDYFECYEYVEMIAEEKKDVLPLGIVWANNFIFKAYAEDGTALMGQCQQKSTN